MKDMAKAKDVINIEGYTPHVQNSIYLHDSITFGAPPLETTLKGVIQLSRFKVTPQSKIVDMAKTYIQHLYLHLGDSQSLVSRETRRILDGEKEAIEHLEAQCKYDFFKEGKTYLHAILGQVDDNESNFVIENSAGMKEEERERAYNVLLAKNIDDFWGFSLEFGDDNLPPPRTVLDPLLGACVTNCDLFRVLGPYQGHRPEMYMRIVANAFDSASKIKGITDSSRQFVEFLSEKVAARWVENVGTVQREKSPLLEMIVLRPSFSRERDPINL